MSTSVQSSSSARELDPLLKDLTEKKQSFRRNVLSMAAELKDVRNRLASREETIFRETLTRQACNLVGFSFYSCGSILRWRFVLISV